LGDSPIGNSMLKPNRNPYGRLYPFISLHVKVEFMHFMRHRAWPGFLVLLCLLTGLITPLPGIEGRAYAADGPDLAIQSVTWSPQTPSIDNLVSFTVTVKNQGDSLADTSRILLLIDDYTAGSAFISQMAAGAIKTCTFSWKAKAGAHIAKIVIDSEAAVIETDENNNEESCAFSVLAPDLVVEDISWTPENPSSDEYAEYSITIKNHGDKTAAACKVGLFIDGNLWGYRDIDALDAGEEFVATYSLKATTGLHSIEAFADVLNRVQESDETNNTKTETQISAMADLTITGITYGPENRTESEELTVSVTIKNIGNGNASYSSLALYIDDFYEASEFVQGIDVGDTATVTFSREVSTNEHVVRAIIDTSAIVPEINETNNSLTVTVPPLASDLYVQSITWSPEKPLISHMTYFTVTIKNKGVCASTSCDLEFYIGESDNYHAYISPLSPGETFSVTFPWVTQSDSASVLAVIDEDNFLVESNEGNNTATASVGFAVAAPTADLVIQSITYTPSSPAVGDVVTFSVKAKNQGSGVVGSVNIACYIDGDLLDYYYLGRISSGETVEKLIHWTALSGGHEIMMVIDPEKNVLETNEANNTATTSLATTAPDLTIEKIAWFPVEPDTGDDVMFTVTIKNRGNQTAGSCYITYYIDGSAKGNHYLYDIASGASVTKSFTWNMQASSHTFKAIIDEAGVMIESNETNNEKSVFLPAPNLTIESITCSDDYPAAGTTLTLTVKTLNTGGGSAAGVRITAYIDDVSLTVLNTGTINADSAVENVFTWSAVSGKHTLRVTADAGNTITESDESDNTKEVIIFVPLPSSTASSEPPGSEAAPPANTAEPAVTPTVPAEILEDTPEATEEALPDISGNLSASPDEESDGIMGILMNKWLIIGVAVAGIGAIAVLLLLRKRAGQPKKEKPPKTPKPPKPAKEAKASPKKAGPVKAANTLSGKPPVIVLPGKGNAPVKAIVPPDARRDSVPPPRPAVPPAAPPHQQAAPPPAQPPVQPPPNQQPPG